LIHRNAFNVYYADRAADFELLIQNAIMNDLAERCRTMKSAKKIRFFIGAVLEGEAGQKHQTRVAARASGYARVSGSVGGTDLGEFLLTWEFLLTIVDLRLF